MVYINHRFMYGINPDEVGGNYFLDNAPIFLTKNDHMVND